MQRHYHRVASPADLDLYWSLMHPRSLSRTFALRCFFLKYHVVQQRAMSVLFKLYEGAGSMGLPCPNMQCSPCTCGRKFKNRIQPLPSGHTTLKQRRINVKSTFCQRRVPAGFSQRTVHCKIFPQILRKTPAPLQNFYGVLGVAGEGGGRAALSFRWNFLVRWGKNV